MRSVGWITLCFFSCIAGPVSVALAQSLDVRGQTAGTVNQSVKPAKAVERTANDPATAASQGPGLSRAQVEHGNELRRLTPPAPERKPRALIVKPKTDAAWPIVLSPKDSNGGTSAVGQEPSQAAIKEPEFWTAAEINIARARCAHLFKTLDAVTLPEEPMKEGACGDPAPVRLISLGTNPAVTLSPPPIINCQMVAALHTWLEKDLQPLARKYLRTPITGINVMSSYSCRNTYGRATGRLSEHGRANALDIRGFETKKGPEPQLLAHWGPTEQDIEEARRLAAEKAAAEKAARLAEAAKRRAETAKNQKANVAGGFAFVGGGLYKSLVEGLDETAEATTGQPGALGLAPSKLGGPKPVEEALPSDAKAPMKITEPIAAAPTPPVAPAPAIVGTSAMAAAPSKRPTAPVNTRYARFLREAHVRACDIFGTVLGPEANKAHRNHLHVDLAKRDLGNYCR